MIAAAAYDRMRAATVTIEKLDAAGESRAASAGVAVAGGRVVTAFSAVDGAARVRITNGRGESVDVQQLLASDRAGDWAVLPVPETLATALDVGSASEGKVGDHVYVLGSTGLGSSRSLVDTNLSGDEANERGGRGLTIAMPKAASAIGGPVLDDYGAAIGLIAGPPLPGFFNTEFRSVGPSTWTAVVHEQAPEDDAERGPHRRAPVHGRCRSLPPGIYRIDALIGADAARREGGSGHNLEEVAPYPRHDAMACRAQAARPRAGLPRRSGLLTSAAHLVLTT